ncbi:MAG: hypothetical protein ACTTJ7_07075 [Treponema sp.]
MIYKEKIEKLLSEDILKKITIQSGMSFCVEELMVKHNTHEVSLVS